MQSMYASNAGLPDLPRGALTLAATITLSVIRPVICIYHLPDNQILDCQSPNWSLWTSGFILVGRVNGPSSPNSNLELKASRSRYHMIILMWWYHIIVLSIAHPMGGGSVVISYLPPAFHVFFHKLL